MLEDIGFVDVQIGPPIDTFGDAGGEKNARAFEVFGFPFLARKPARDSPISGGVWTSTAISVT